MRILLKKITKISFIIILLFTFFSKALFAQYHFNNISEKIRYYKGRYTVENPFDKITDNKGNGYELLYGTRNMRVILYGVAYRGGANNYYHRTNKRDNKNPLSQDALHNLQKEGFSASIYLYKTNYNDSLKYYINKTSNDTLFYIHNSLSNREQIRELMLLVKDAIENPSKGPIYLHCWNGWHQSGYASALILMQFCKITKEQALFYWRTNTDGVSKGYEKVEKRIIDFVPFNDIGIDDSVRKLICPCLE